MLMLMLACTEPQTTVPTDTDVADAADDTSAPEEATLYGQPPAEALLAPEFTATNYDGTTRSKVNLQGQPTVMWFFPAAGTYG